MSDNKKQTNKTTRSSKTTGHQNILEALRGGASDIAGGTVRDVKDNAKALPKDFMEQLFGSMPKRSASAEIPIGEEAVDMQDVYSGKHEENQKLKQQLAFERRLRQEEDEYKNSSLSKHNYELKEIINQTEKLVTEAKELKEEIKIEAERAVLTEDKSTLERIMVAIFRAFGFLEYVREEVQMAKNANQSFVWNTEHKSRSKKKKGAFWGNYHSKKQGGGASTLLSGESYVSRSAG